MENTPNLGNESENNSHNQPQSGSPRDPRPPRQRRWLVWLGVFLLLSVGGSLTVAWIFMQRMLAPMVEKNVENLIERDVQLGKLESFSLKGLRFGPTELPATATDPDRVSIRAVDVSYNPLKFLLDRTLELNLTLVNPDVYIEQDQQGEWISTRLVPQPPGAIKIDLQSLRLRNAEVVLASRGVDGKLQEAVEFSLPTGKARFLYKNELIQYKVSGSSAAGGKLQLQGESRPQSQETNLAITTTNLNTAVISRLIQLPLDLQAGQVSGNLEIASKPEQPLQFAGITTLSDVTFQLAQLPQLFSKTNGRLTFQGTQIKLEDVTTLFGQIPAQAQGVVDVQSGINLAAQTQPVELKQILQTWNLQELPVKASAEVQAKLKVTGPLDNPLVAGEVVTTKQAQLDQVNFSKIRANFELVPSTQILAVNDLRATPIFGGLVTGNGKVKIGEQGNAIFDLQTSKVPADAIAKIYNFQLPVPVGLVNAKTRITAPIDKPKNFRITGSAQLPAAGGTLMVNNIEVANGRWQGLVQATGVALEQLSSNIPKQFQGKLRGTFNLAGSLDSPELDKISGEGSAAVNVAGGLVTATNIKLNNGLATALVQADGLKLERIAQVPPSLRTPLNGQLQLAVNLNDLTTSGIVGAGAASLNLGGGKITANRIELAKGRWQAVGQATGVQLGRIISQLPPQLAAPLSGNFNLSGSLEEFALDKIKGSGRGRLDVGNGRVLADVTLGAGNWQADVQTAGVNLAEVLPQLPPQLAAPLSGNFNLVGNLQNFSPQAISGSGSGTLRVADGRVDISNLALTGGNWQADVNAQAVSLRKLAPQLPPELAGPLTGKFNLAGNLENLSPTAINVSGGGTLQVAGGSLEARNLRLTNGNLQGIIEPNGIELARFSSELSGLLNGSLNLSGRVDNLTPVALAKSLRAEGQLNFSQGISLVEGNLTTNLRWTGEGVEIGQLTAEGLNAKGFVGINVAALVNQKPTQAIRNLNLYDVVATGLNLEELPLPLPAAIDDLKIAGLADFNGRIAGTPQAPQVNGNLVLRNFVIDRLNFEPVMAGSVSLVPGEGVSVQLAGEEDRIEVALTPNYQPLSFDIKLTDSLGDRQEPIVIAATGKREGQELIVNATNFPIAWLKDFAPLPAEIASQPFAGLLSSENLAVNLNNFNFAGKVAIAQPIFGTLRGKEFIGELKYANGELMLKDGQFLKGDNTYLLSANFKPTAKGPELFAQLEVPQGELQDLLVTLQIFEIADLTRRTILPQYDKAIDVSQVAQVGSPQERLQNQLRRLSEIEVLLEQQRQQRAEASPFPELANAKGLFKGKLTLNVDPTSGVKADFNLNNLEGQNWTWDDPYTPGTDYVAQEVEIKGKLENGVLTLLPFRLQSENSIASFKGTIGGDSQSGQLRLENIPVNAMRRVVGQFVNLPPALGFGGQVNAQATIGGGIKNPQARGVLDITNATVNQTSVQAFQGSFGYEEGRLDFSANSILSEESDPLKISGSIPYKLPFAEIASSDNQLTLNIDVENEGLKILNILSRSQVGWVKGAGKANLTIEGSIDPETNKPQSLIAKGTVVVEDATIEAQVLRGEPLTNVNGTINFDFDNIEIVNELTGQFSGGTITATGSLPIYRPVPQQNPLTINIGELALNLKGLYKGGVKGNVFITGSALSPGIGGNVNLFDGQVQLAGAGATDETSADSENNEFAELNNLQLTLAEDVEIRQAPLFNFLAKGDLVLNGSFGQLRPQGTINLLRGRVNLFTTQLRLARRYNNTASFSPEQGLDPELDVRLVASVAETSRRQIPTSVSAEISDGVEQTSFGSVQTIRVQAEVEGRASELVESLVGNRTDALQLTSTPGRSETEIVALLGGGFADTFGRGDSTLGLASLAGSALLSNVGYFIGEALGLSEFRLSPSTIIDDDDERTSKLGVSAEAGLDISNNFSVSVSKELTNSDPFQYNLRYRINDELLLRGGTNFDDESRVILEYETRF
ncbi:MAG: translocation/assembly module TamB domain-containing protein [Coleofasciculaceae cyanobacterium]